VIYDLGCWVWYDVIRRWVVMMVMIMVLVTGRCICVYVLIVYTCTISFLVFGYTFKSGKNVRFLFSILHFVLVLVGMNCVWGGLPMCIVHRGLRTM
jgi:hypothetical protein